MAQTGKPSRRKAAVSGFIWMFSERLATQLVSFVVSVVLARLLSPSDYGIIAMVLVFITLANTFVTSGFATALIQKKDADETDFSTMFYCSLVCSFVLYGIIFAAAPAIEAFYDQPSLCLVLRVFALRIPISAFGAIQHAYVSRHLLFKRFFWSSLFGTLVSGVVGVAMAMQGFGVWALIAQYFADTIVDALVLLLTVPWRPRLLFSWAAAKPLMSYGWKVLAADLSGTFFGQLRSLIVGKFYTPADLAFYNKGQQLPQLITTNLSTAVMGVLFPIMSNESSNTDSVRQICRRCMQVMSYLTAPLLLGMAATATDIVVLLFTDKWLECVPYLQVLSMGFTIGVLGVIPLQALKAIGRSDVVLQLEFIKKPVYVLLLVVGVYKGTMAIAVTMALYELYGTIVNIFQMKRYLNYGIKTQLRDIVPSIACASAMGVAVYLVPLSLNNLLLGLMLKVLLGIALYVGLTALFGIEPYKYLRDAVVQKLANRGEPSTG